MSKIFKASIIIGVSFGINKILALLRQYLIASEFGFSPEIDAFNVANNMPDLIFSLFSGGALAMAFIPVFAEYLDVHGHDLSWKLFSKVTSLLFLATAGVSLIIAFLAPILVSSQIGIAPGFSDTQQALVVDLLRINLIATLIFSVSGLVVASLQAHKHFLLPAIAPIFYNLGIIFGAVFLAPTMGIYGLTYGVVLGAMLHLLIQIPGLRHFKFRFSFSIDFKEEGVRKILRLMGPRILTVFFIQITFLLRDNFASRLDPGSVTALTYGYFIMQVPETLIGSSIAIALLPTLASHISKKRQKEFARALATSIRVLIAASLLPTVLIFAVLSPLVELLFDFSPSNTELLVWTTNAFMAGLLAHVLLEVFVRAFYAKQEATIPLYATALRTFLFVILGVYFYKSTGVVGIAAIDSITVAIEAIFLFILLLPLIAEKTKIAQTLGKSIAGSLASIGIIWTILTYLHVPVLIQISIALVLATILYTLFVVKEVKLFAKL
jgi:putative peptidoglycan lipid II flippase